MLKGETVLSGAPHPGTDLQVMKSSGGWYVGYADEDGQPYTRETQYFRTQEAAQFWILWVRK